MFHHWLNTWFFHLTFCIHTSVKFLIFLKIYMTSKVNWKRVEWPVQFWMIKKQLNSQVLIQLYETLISNDWLYTTSYTNKQLFFNLVKYYNSLCQNLPCLYNLMIRWWWTNSQWCNQTLARQLWVTKVCLRASKISKIYVWLPKWVSNFLKSKFWKIV